jgi:hypothetical protein
VLALILAQKHDYAAAGPLLHAFLEQNPDLPDAPNIRLQLASIEEAARQAPQEKAAPRQPSPENTVQEKQ